MFRHTLDFNSTNSLVFNQNSTRKYLFIQNGLVDIKKSIHRGLTLHVFHFYLVFVCLHFVSQWLFCTPKGCSLITLSLSAFALYCPFAYVIEI